MKHVKKRELKDLVRKKVISVSFVSDDGEYYRYKILPNGPEIGEWGTFGQTLLVVNEDTVHENFLKAYPQLFESLDGEHQKSVEVGE